MQLAFYLLVFISVSSVTATFLPFIRSDEWWIRIFDFPRAQILVVLALTALLLVVGIVLDAWTRTSFQYILLLLTLAAFIVQAFWMVSFVPGYPHEVRPAADIRQERGRVDILVANLKFDNTNFSKFVELVTENSPHLIFLTELNETWHKELRSLDRSYPYSVKVVRDDGHGMALLSTERITHEQKHYLISDERPSIAARLHLNDNTVIDLWGLHPAPPGIKMSNGERKDSSPRDAELLVVADRVADYRVPTIVLGDLNDTAWSKTTSEFKQISGLLDPRVGRGLFNTYHTEYFLLRYPIDHFFLSSHFYINSIKRLDDFGSDHFPMLLSVFVGEPYSIGKSHEEGKIDEQRKDRIEEGKRDAERYDQHAEKPPD
jgi:endonuclease/exonuclease/phosphatase (EEP) superfamily protein YafD